MTNPVKKRVVTLDDLNVLNQNAAYARQKGEVADAAATRATTAAEQAEQAAGALPSLTEAAGLVNEARVAAGYLAPLAAAKDQADQNHARATQDHQQVTDSLTGIAQDRALAQQATQAANDAADVIGAAGLLYAGTDAEGIATLVTVEPRVTVTDETAVWAVIDGSVTLTQPSLTIGGTA